MEGRGRKKEEWREHWEVEGRRWKKEEWREEWERERWGRREQEQHLALVCALDGEKGIGVVSKQQNTVADGETSARTGPDRRCGPVSGAGTGQGRGD